MTQLLEILQTSSNETFSKAFYDAVPNQRFEAFFKSVYLDMNNFNKVLTKMSRRMNLIQLFIVHCSECNDPEKFNLVISYVHQLSQEKEWVLAFNKYETHPYLTKCLILHNKTPSDIIKSAVKYPKIFTDLKTDEIYKTEKILNIMKTYDVFGEEIKDDITNDIKIVEDQVQEVITKTVCVLL